MIVKEMIDKLGFEVLVLADESKEVKGAFVGDLLSWVMGHGKEDQAWITVQTHLNVVAVALLREFSCLIVAEGASVAEETIVKAKDEGLTILRSADSAFEICRKLIECGL